jgi:osmoprotectant transport system ATP-binding protein
MDEPFAAIDNITRRRLQDELLSIQGKVRKTILFVTHDVEEAIRLADKVVVMRQGKVVQYDTPLHILSRPADSFVADLMGTEDVLRRLSLLSVQSVLEEGEGGETAAGPTLANTASLRDALNVLLVSESDSIVVTDERGRPVGTLNLGMIRQVLRGDS